MMFTAREKAREAQAEVADAAQSLHEEACQRHDQAG